MTQYDCQLEPNSIHTVGTSFLPDEFTPGVSGKPFTAIEMTVDLKVKPEAESVRAQHWNDDSVQWLNPQLGGKPVNKRGWRKDQAVAQDNPRYPHVSFERQPDGTVKMTGYLYPTTNLSDNTAVDVLMTQQAYTHDSGGMYTTTGSNPCGRIVYHNGAWQASPSGQVKPAPVVTEVFESNK